MDSLLLLLKENIVLSIKEITTLRSHIEKKHRHKDGLFKANIMANTINTIIDTNLYSCSVAEKEEIRPLLIDRYLIKGNKPITHFSVFTELIEYDKDLDSSKSRLANWLSVSYEDKYISKDLENYILKNRKKSFEKETVDSEKEVYTFKKEADTDNTIKKNVLPVKKEPVKSEVINSYFIKKQSIRHSLSILVLGICLIVSFLFIDFDFKFKNRNNSLSIMELYDIGNRDIVSSKYINRQSVIPHYLTYKNISKSKLVAYLEGKHSLLTTGDYLNTIYKLSSEYNVNPLLVLAIIGQEQNFVPKNNIYSNMIINNPYNVFGSWKKYNTNFEDSTRIVLNTVINRLSEKPYYEDPFKWLNKTYAEDQVWWQGVKRIFKKLNKVVN